MDERTAETLFAAIVSFVGERGGYVTKTKLLKLLYLFDVEYFRVHRRTFTGFDWKFLHLGPWTAEYEPLLSDVVTKGILSEKFSRHDTPLYWASETTQTSPLKLPVTDEAILTQVLRQWGGADTNEILDYVYFNTEPMLSGVRSQPLDFSAIQPLPPVYKRSSSGASPKEIEQKRQALRKKQSGAPISRRTAQITPPRYDEQFDRAMAILESE